MPLGTTPAADFVRRNLKALPLGEHFVTLRTISILGEMARQISGVNKFQTGFLSNPPGTFERSDCTRKPLVLVRLESVMGVDCLDVLLHLAAFLIQHLGQFPDKVRQKL